MSKTVKDLLTKLKSVVKPKSIHDIETEYLSQSVDLVDLEIRQRRIQNGTAPFQTNYTRHW